MTHQLILFAGCAGGGCLGEHVVDGFIGTGDHVRADDFAASVGSGCGAGIDGGLDGGDIAADDGIAESGSDLLHRSGEFDVGGFEHRVDADNESGESAGFNESECLFGQGIGGVGVVC